MSERRLTVAAVVLVAAVFSGWLAFRGASTSPPPITLFAGDGRIFAVQSGLLRSRPDGDLAAPWANLPVPVSVTALVATPHQWWLLGEDRVFSSYDAGSTWTELARPPRLASHPPTPPTWRALAVSDNGILQLVGADGVVAWGQSTWLPLTTPTPADLGAIAMHGQAWVAAGTPWQLWCGIAASPPQPCTLGLPTDPQAPAAYRIALRGDGRWLIGAPGGVYVALPQGWTNLAKSATTPTSVGASPVAADGVLVGWADGTAALVDANGTATALSGPVLGEVAAAGRAWVTDGRHVDVIDATGADTRVPAP